MPFRWLRTNLTRLTSTRWTHTILQLEALRSDGQVFSVHGGPETTEAGLRGYLDGFLGFELGNVTFDRDASPLDAYKGIWIEEEVNGCTE